jgi:hypothetical protein
MEMYCIFLSDDDFGWAYFKVFIATNLQSEFFLQQVVKKTFFFFVMIKVGMEVAHQTLFVDFSFFLDDCSKCRQNGSFYPCYDIINKSQGVLLSLLLWLIIGDQMQEESNSFQEVLLMLLIFPIFIKSHLYLK